MSEVGTSGRLARTFAALRQEAGNVGMIFALAAVPLMAGAGFLVDYARLAKARGSLQSAVDSAIVAGLRAEPAARAGTVRAVVSATAPTRDLTIDTIDVRLLDSGNRVSLRVDASVPLLLSSGLGRLFSVGARGEGRLMASAAAPPTVCLLLTDLDAAHSLTLDQGAVLEAPTCEIHVHSGRTEAARLAEGSRLVAARLCLAGTNYAAAAAEIVGPVVTRCTAADDPFTRDIIPPPVLAGCDHTDLDVQDDATLLPGTYCGRTRFPNRGTARLSPGLYVIRDGAFEAAANVTIAGEGVTFFLADENAGFDIRGRASLALSAPPDGSRAGVLFHEPDGLPLSTLRLTGGGGHVLNGLVHLPSRRVRLDGSAAPTPDATTFVFAQAVFRQGSSWRFGSAARTILVPGARPPARIVLSR